MIERFLLALRETVGDDRGWFSVKRDDDGSSALVDPADTEDSFLICDFLFPAYGPILAFHNGSPPFTPLTAPDQISPGGTLSTCNM